MFREKRTVTRRLSTCYSLVAIARAVHTMQCLLYGSESRSIMYTFIYRNLHSHGYEDVTIHHQRTPKNTITLLNIPYIYSHSHTQSHSPRAPPWPSPPASCRWSQLSINTWSLLAPSFSPAGAIHQQEPIYFLNILLCTNIADCCSRELRSHAI